MPPIVPLPSLAAALTGSVGFLSDALESGVNLIAAVVALTGGDLTGTSARIRAERADGSWGPWYQAETLESGGADGVPSPGSQGPRGTDPVFVGLTTAVQIAVRRPAGAPVTVGDPVGPDHTGQYHLGPVDFAETEWHNACAPYPANIRAITGNMIAGVSNTVAEPGSLCDACIEVTTATGRTEVLRAVTYGESGSDGDLDVSPEAYEALNMDEFPRTMTWHLVACDNAEPLYLQFQTEANVWWTSLWVRNARVPLAKVLGTGRFDQRQIPKLLLTRVVDDGVASRMTTTAAEEPVIVVGIPLPDQGATYFEFVSLSDVDETLNSVGLSLVFGALITSMFGVVIGWFAASRAVRPLADAAQAARVRRINRYGPDHGVAAVIGGGVADADAVSTSKAALDAKALAPQAYAAAMKLLGEAHETAAWALIGMVALHAAAALWHHFVRRDNVLRAMLPAFSGSAQR